MTRENRPVRIVRRSLGPAPWSELRLKIADFCHWSEASDLTVYDETVRECTLTGPVRFDAIAPRQSFEGRMFDDTAEARWVTQDDDVSFRVWMIRESDEQENEESPDNEKHVDDVDAKMHRSENGETRTWNTYYLLGRATEDRGIFTEGRYTGRSFEYPVRAGQKGKSRAFIKVIEYVRPMPKEWLSHGGPAAPERDPVHRERHMDKLETCLNAPMLVAHRFVGVDVD